MGNSFYLLVKLSRSGSDMLLCWTGDSWSIDMDDGVLFRHAGSAYKFAATQGWTVCEPHKLDTKPNTVSVRAASPQLAATSIRFK